MENKITTLADKIRDGSIKTEDLKGFIEKQFPLIRKSKQKASEDHAGVFTEDFEEAMELEELEESEKLRVERVEEADEAEEAIEEPEAYTVAHSLFERMVEERMSAEAILEEPEEWGFTEENKTEAAEGLKEHAEDFYKLAEKLLMVAWHGYEKA